LSCPTLRSPLSSSPPPPSCVRSFDRYLDVHVLVDSSCTLRIYLAAACLPWTNISTAGAAQGALSCAFFPFFLFLFRFCAGVGMRVWLIFPGRGKLRAQPGSSAHPRARRDPVPAFAGSRSLSVQPTLLALRVRHFPVAISWPSLSIIILFIWAPTDFFAAAQTKTSFLVDWSTRSSPFPEPASSRRYARRTTDIRVEGILSAGNTTTFKIIVATR
jgi:hypothetical protein